MVVANFAVTPRTGFTSHITPLREQILLALSFPAAPRTLAVVLYGISPAVPLAVDGKEYTIGPRKLRIPVSRLLHEKDATFLHDCALTQSFAAHAQAMGCTFSLVDLQRSSDDICAIAGIGRAVRNAIAQGDACISTQALRRAADSADILLLSLVGEAIGTPYAEAAQVLHNIQTSGADIHCRAQWVKDVMNALSWNVCTSAAMAVLDKIICPSRIVSARERFEARMRIGSELSRV